MIYIHTYLHCPFVVTGHSNARDDGEGMAERGEEGVERREEGVEWERRGWQVERRGCRGERRGRVKGEMGRNTLCNLVYKCN